MTGSLANKLRKFIILFQLTFFDETLKKFRAPSAF
jgi:hypothetical protein